MANCVKRLPERRCVACRESKPKAELLRVVKYNGGLSVDESGKSDGRGAYVCKSKSCVLAAKKGRRLEKALRMQIPEEIYDTLEKLLSDTEVE